jgi:hypothetical protein
MLKLSQRRTMFCAGSFLLPLFGWNVSARPCEKTMQSPSALHR